MDNIKFGIVIATYKRLDGKTPMYLNRALDSILKQEYKNYKVFLIGDKYDDSNEFESFGIGFTSENFYKENLQHALEREKYSDKFTLWCCGGLNAFNYGTDICIEDGIKYIIRLDHDDWFEPNHLQNFNECISKYGADFMFSKSTYLGNTILPKNIHSSNKFIEALPVPFGMVNSSHCMNVETIKLRSRNVYEETGNQYASDADLWERLVKYIPKNKLKSYLINETTCHHDSEGHIKS